MLLTNSNGEYRTGQVINTTYCGARPSTAFSCMYTTTIARKLWVRNRKAGDRESNFTVQPAGRRCNAQKGRFLVRSPALVRSGHDRKHQVRWLTSGPGLECSLLFVDRKV